MTKLYLHTEESNISWGDSFRGMMGKKAKAGIYTQGTDLHVDKKTIVATAAIGLTVGIIALLIAATAIALILGFPVTGLLAFPVLVGIAAGAGTLGIICTIFGSIAANALEIGVKYSAQAILAGSVHYV